VVCMVSKGCNGVGDVRAGTQHGIHKGAKGTLVSSGIDLGEGELVLRQLELVTFRKLT